MTWFDYGVLLVIAASLILGGWRGFVREAFSLGGWVAGAILGFMFAKPVANLAFGFVPEPFLRGVLAFILILVVTLLAAGLAGLLVAKLVHAAGMGLSDRAVGAVFGVARGLVIVMLIVLAAGLTGIPHEPFWRESRLAPPLETAAIAAKPYLPAALAERITYR
jgi:membrane protein required for colicin V production